MWAARGDGSLQMPSAGEAVLVVQLFTVNTPGKMKLGDAVAPFCFGIDVQSNRAAAAVSQGEIHCSTYFIGDVGLLNGGQMHVQPEEKAKWCSG